MIPIIEVEKEASNKNLTKEKVDETIEKLKRAGEIYEPKREFIQKI